MQLKPLSALVLGLLLSAGAHAAPTFVNGLAISGATLDLSIGSDTDRRVGFFSDIYYDPNRNEWWGLSDRGPGGGTLNYETRVQRFTLDVNGSTGLISNFQVAQTVKFANGGSAMNGLAPNPANTLGNSLDPEGFVVNPKTGNFLVSDEYGPSVNEFDRSGNLVRQYTIPSNLIPKSANSNPNYNAPAPNASANPPIPVSDSTLSAGREGNRGFEGLAISPNGDFAYAMLQNGTFTDGFNTTNGARGQYTRIVKFDTSTGKAVGQYAYKLDSSGQGRGISSLVAINDHEFMVLERNNRGIGVGANPASPDKNVYMIDLTGASDVTGISLPGTGALPSGVSAVTKAATKFIDLDADTLAALGNKSPEKWEGLSIGPKLADGSYLLLAGTDNDYSVTQNGTGTQFDVYFRFTDADPYASSIQCALGSTTACFTTASSADADGYSTTTSATLTSDYQLLPGVLHAYKVSAAELSSYTAPVPEPETYALMLAGLGLLGFMARRRKV